MKQIKFKSSMEQIESMICASVPIIWVNTYDESRFIKDLWVNISEHQKLKRELWTWSAYQGLVKYDPMKSHIFSRAGSEMDRTWIATNGLEAINKHVHDSNQYNGSIFVMKDFHTVLAQPIPRMLRDFYDTLKSKKQTIIVVAPAASILSGNGDCTLDKQVVVVDYEYPSAEYIRDKIDIISNNKRAKKEGIFKTDYTEEEKQQFVRALQGLTEYEINSSLYTSITHLKEINTDYILSEKKQIIKKSGILEYIDTGMGIEDIGGLDLAKEYFEKYKDQFSDEAREFGLEPLRAVLLTGIPGCGKSAIVKAIGNQWKLPLIRFDMGRVMGSLVGQSESNMRQAIQQLEAIGHSICWIDEIEKGLSGTNSSSHTDGGTTARVFGTLLTAMEEGLKNTVILATANNIDQLPPELIRRFNEIMFVDLPYPKEREEIFKIHLEKRNRSLKGINTKQIVQHTHKFTGSEIEKIVKEAIVKSWNDNRSKLKTKHIVEAIEETKPVSSIMGEKITKIRDWAKNRARYASSLARNAAEPGKQKISTSSGKELDLDSSLGDIDEISKKKTTASDDSDLLDII